MSAAAPHWDAELYERNSDPQLTWGLEVIDRLTLRGDETVLDAGCGSGRLTRALVERLPRGRVVAVDGATSMVERARTTLGDAAEVRLADLAGLELSEPVDVVFSNAVFHWIPDREGSCLPPFLERLPEELHEDFTERLVAELGEPLHLDYVRLNLSAQRP